MRQAWKDYIQINGYVSYAGDFKGESCWAECLQLIGIGFPPADSKALHIYSFYLLESKDSAEKQQHLLL
ncbi:MULTISPECIES: hypothetical protein [Acinetobacter]|uniref:Uncharacterized protein n=1 Tax=Acinetobacter entericus TaxID=2989714 RepID=A0ABT3NK69_9GAMM|nr:MULTISPECIES: hypothetical protein [Acinetobacter]MCW8039957.1 hypothetical protein [Acinetobacter entericus]TCB71179.1 hypothetical protein E0H91_17090 [Acinetobacter sp. ANC 4177]